MVVPALRNKGPPDWLAYTSYPATPTLSVDASHVRPAAVAVGRHLHARRGRRRLGVGPLAVAAVTMFDCGEEFPAASFATTANS